jgi:pimeloyl-ACP methyl ester carboxylesterase
VPVFRDIVVLLPGIVGSVLQKDDHDVFGLTVGAGLRGLLSGGRSVRDLRLIDDPPDVDDLEDGVTPARVASDAHLIPGLWKVDGYGKVAERLQRRLRLEPGATYFEFPYDWRRDNRVAARKLQADAAGWLAVRRRSDPDARLVLIAHSMGGLVARYYLEVLEGWRDTRMLITFGTPYRGALNAVDFLAHGFRKLFGLVDLTDALRSFTSVYQLLPIYPCLDEGDGKLVRLTEATRTVPGVDQARAQAARAFHGEIEDAVARHRQDDEYRQAGYRLHQVVGMEHPTRQSVLVRDGRIELSFTWAGEELFGDGTVPRVSASPQEFDTDDDALFAGTRHASLQNADAVLTQVRGWLTGQDLSGFRAGAPVSVSVDLDDAYLATEPIVVRIRPSEAGKDLRVRLEPIPAATPRPPDALTVDVPVVEDWRLVELPPQPPGCYRVAVSGDESIEPVEDLVVVGAAS